MPSHSIDSTEYDSMNDEPCWWEQGLQGELQAAIVEKTMTLATSGNIHNKVVFVHLLTEEYASVKGDEL